MNCIKCGVDFHPSDIEVMSEEDEQICDECAYEELNRTRNIH